MTDQLQPGDRVELLAPIDDEWTNLEVGATGTVTSRDAAGTIHIEWDTGSTLGLIEGVDQWRKLPPLSIAQYRELEDLLRRLAADSTGYRSIRFWGNTITVGGVAARLADWLRDQVADAEEGSR